MDSYLQHHDTDSTHVVFACIVLLVDSTGDFGGSVVEKVVMQTSVSGAKELLLQEERVVKQCQSIEDVESRL